MLNAPNKYKKKKSFLKKVEKQEKFGIYGKGKPLSEEEYHYYIRIYKELKHVEKDEKGKNNFFLLFIFKNIN